MAAQSLTRFSHAGHRVPTPIEDVLAIASLNPRALLLMAALDDVFVPDAENGDACGILRAAHAVWWRARPASRPATGGRG